MKLIKMHWKARRFKPLSIIDGIQVYRYFMQKHGPGHKLVHSGGYCRLARDATVCPHFGKAS